jgi:hypothetical protein
MTLLADNKRLILFFALILFIIAKTPHLDDPFYWDESWVYGPGVRTMYENGPSLLPDAIPVDLSRGHPLFFHFAASLWATLFGPSLFALHCFGLFVFVLLAVTVFEIMLALFSYRVAVISLLLLLCNLSFLTASSLLLNDILLALLTILSLYSYSKGQFVRTAIFLTLIVFTKESGLVVCALVGIDLCYRTIYSREPRGTLIKRYITLAVPLLLTGLFFVIQKKMLGWYLYPGHTSAINLDIVNTFSLSRTILSVFFYNERIYYFWLVPVVLSFVAAIKQKNLRYLSIPAFAIVMYLMLRFFNSKDAVYYAFVPLSLIGLAWLFLRRLSRYNPLQKRFILYAVAFVVAHTYFCAVNFYEMRYVFPALLLVSVVLLALLTDYLIDKTYNRMFVPVAALIPVLSLLNYSLGTDAFVMYDHLEVQQHIVDYFEEHNLHSKKIWTYTYLHQSHLQDKKAGFLRNEKPFNNVSLDLNEQTEFLIVDNIEFGDQYLHIRTDSAFRQVYRYQKGGSWGEVYIRR